MADPAPGPGPGRGPEQASGPRPASFLDGPLDAAAAARHYLPCGPAARATHERVVAGLVAWGFPIALPNLHPEGWRAGPLLLDVRSAPRTPPRPLAVYPVDAAALELPAVRVDLARRVAPVADLLRAGAGLVVTTDALGPAARGWAAELEGLAGAPVVLVGGGSGAGGTGGEGGLELVAGPEASTRGHDDDLRRALAAPPRPPTPARVDQVWRRRIAEAQAGELFARLRDAMPTAWVTGAVIAACALLHAGAELLGRHDDLVRALACRGGAVAGGEPWRVLTSGLVHGGWLHLGINLWVLRDLGGLVERLLGRPAYAGLLAASVASGGVGSVLTHPWVTSVGISGGIFGLGGGVLAYLAVRRRTLPLGLLLRLGRSFGLFVAANIGLGLAISGAGLLAIDNAGHVGGLAGGLVAGALLARPFPPPPAWPRALAWRLPLVLALALAAALAVGRAPHVARERELLALRDAMRALAPALGQVARLSALLDEAGAGAGDLGPVARADAYEALAAGRVALEAATTGVDPHAEGLRAALARCLDAHADVAAVEGDPTAFARARARARDAEDELGAALRLP